MRSSGTTVARTTDIPMDIGGGIGSRPVGQVHESVVSGCADDDVQDVAGVELDDDSAPGRLGDCSLAALRAYAVPDGHGRGSCSSHG